MDNFTRGDKALEALTAVGYQDPERTLGITIPTPDGGEVPGPEGYPISDLVADLCHLAQRSRLDFMHLLDEGVEHYGADIIEQAFQNDDENWGECLQAKSNIPVAETVLRTAGVPARYDDAIFVKTGLLPADEASD